MNRIDLLIENILKTKNPSVIGLDPDITKIPSCYKQNRPSSLKETADTILTFNRDIIDTVAPFVPAVKPQMAFYEAYGSYGVRAFEETVKYARSKGLVVIEDAKRNDIGNIARAYADGHLGTVAFADGSQSAVYDVDFLTVSPFLGSESIDPFEMICKTHHKGIFVLIKTSNTSAGEIQDIIHPNGMTVSQMLALDIAKRSETYLGTYGYSPIGAVVGATYPEDASVLRKLMPHSYLLVPGFGAQGAEASDVIPCFDEKGLGAIVNSSRGILYTHLTDEERNHCTKNRYLESVRSAVLRMKQTLYQTLSKHKSQMLY